MRRFALLYQQLDATTSTHIKVAALVAYFRDTPPADAAWAAWFLAGGKPRQVLPTAVMRAVACRAAGVDDWLFDACYQAVGDLAETIALVLPDAPPEAQVSREGLAHWVEQRLLPLRGLPEDEQVARLLQAWSELDAPGRFLLVKLVGGGFRVGVSKLLVQRALAEVAGLPPGVLAERLVGWTDARQMPTAERFQALLAPAEEPGVGSVARGAQAYPFCLAHPLQQPPESLGPVGDWLAEWKYDGIRAQVVKRDGQVWIWSRGEELVTERFPEVVAHAATWPEGSVVDGELLVWAGDAAAGPASFQQLQQRLGRKTVPKKLLAEAPVKLLAYDLLEANGTDLRARPLAERRAALEALGPRTGLAVSPRVEAADWNSLAAQREEARERGVEGLMLKPLASPYAAGRSKSGGWWKWKVDPLSVDAILVYAQAGHGRRASLYTDYTFAVWSRPPADAAEAEAVLQAIARREPAPPRDSGALQLLPFAKAYSGLTDAEFTAVDREIRAQTLEKFGPVRSVRPTLVFEIGFEGVQASPRHKSGIAVRFPRMLRLRPDKPLHEADSLQSLKALLATPS